MIVVGTYNTDTSPTNRNILVLKSEVKDQAGLGDVDLSSLVQVRTFTSTSDQVAYDVDMTRDGTPYVTGQMTGYVRGGYDCFVMKLNFDLSLTYLKTFGESGTDEKCTSIQVTRNNDYIYLGGERVKSGRYEIFFVKLTAQADGFVSSAHMIYLSYTSNLSLRRILLTNDKAFVGTSDENEFYFCGTTVSNNGDFFFGKIDKNF